MKSFPIITGYTSNSGVGEQPVNNQTLQGARNRILDLDSRVKGLDRIISIETGIFYENNIWLDKSVVVLYDTLLKKEHIAYSDAIVFPDKYVELARQLGFDKTTVSQVMKDAGYISDSKDPNKSISGISRQTYIEDTLFKLVKEVELKR